MTDGEPTDRMGQRMPGGRLRRWVFLSADRQVLTAALLAAVFLALVAVGTVALVSLRAAASGGDPIETLFQTLVTALITGVTLVVTITQLVLSQELGPASDQRERMAGAMSFRRDVADHLDRRVSPPEPAGFLSALVDAAVTNAEALDGAVTEGPHRQQVTRLVADISENADDVGARLDGSEFGTFTVVSAALDYDYSRHLHDARRLQAAGDDLPPDAKQALADLVGTLELFGPAQEHVKTLYFQWELSALSRVILLTAIPSLVVAVGCVLWLEVPGTVTGTTLGVETLLLVVCAATAVAVAPFLLLVAYVLRIVTATKRTLAIGPFLLRETGDE